MNNESSKYVRNGLRILMVGPSLDAWGGVATVERNILGGATAASYTIDFIPTTKDEPAPLKVLTFLRSLSTIKKELFAYDICHVHMALGASYARKYFVCRMAYKRNIPYVLHIHEGDFEGQLEQMSEFERGKISWLFEHAACVVALSSDWERTFSRLFPGAEISVLENAVPIPERISDTKNASKIYFLGLLCPKKGVDTLLGAAKRVTACLPDAHLYIAGGGDAIDGYRTMADAAHIADYVTFLGWANEEKKAKLAKECLIFVLPSLAEGLPMALLEAMASGSAVIATRVGGIPEVIDDGVNGLLIDPGDEEGLASAIIRCVEDEGLAHRLAAAGRDTVVSRFSMTHYMKKLTEIYDSCLGYGDNGAECE